MLTNPTNIHKNWPEPNFWLLQISGWLFYMLFVYMAYHVQRYDSWVDVLVYYLYEAVLGIFITLSLRQIFRVTWRRSLVECILLGSAAVIIGSFVWTTLKVILFLYLFENPFEKEFVGIIFEWLPNSLTVLGGWSAIYCAYKYRSSYHENKSALLSAENEAKEAQLRMLRYQLNPHFLFNTLASVRALVNQNANDKAADMTQKLSDFLRYSLETDPLKSACLGEEIDIIHNYLAIERIRFGERLQMKIQIDPASKQVQVPSMLLQPFVENAIKYAVAPSISGASICISTQLIDNKVLIRVEDKLKDPAEDAQQVSANQRLGIGHNNTRMRLTGFYQDNYSFSAEAQNQGYLVCLTLPLSTRS
ncbi:sensor histidine kinase [Catenovulum sp. SX2]|uniref:sensor histidine kinase n=1 Tax=Catenovulum sp. SX2 TaxID=3398614 RepID=UPI003F836B5F